MSDTPRSPRTVPDASITLGGLDPEGLFRCGTLTPGGAGMPGWEAPTPEHLADLLPELEVGPLLGRGGMSVVYRAVCRDSGRPVALKVLPIEESRDPDRAERFRREIRALMSCRHANLIEVCGFGTTATGLLHFTMELADGGDLASRLRRGSVPIPEAVALLRQVALALGCVHAAGIIHRDLKPSNVLLTREGGVKLADFGVAGLLPPPDGLPQSRLTLTGTVLGTAEYAAPEQIRGEAVDARADLFSLGVLAYELLTGELPRGAFEPPSARGAVDPAYDAVVLKALQSDPSRRFQTAAEFLQALARAADSRANAVARERELRRRLLRRNWWVAAFAGLAVAAVAAARFGFLQRDLAREREAEARRHEALAARNLAEAEKLVATIVWENTDILWPMGKRDELLRLLNAAGRYYEVVVPSTNDAAALDRKASFFLRRGSVLNNLGRIDEALADIDLSIATFGTLVAAHPEDPARRLGLAYACQWRGRFRESRAERDGSASAREAVAEAYQESLALMDDLARRFPDYRPRVPRQAETAALLGDWFVRRERWPEAESALNRARELLATIPPSTSTRDESDRLARTAEIELALAGIHEARRDFARALGHLNRRRAATESLVRLNAGSRAWLDQHAVTLYRTGGALLRSGTPAAGIPELESAERTFVAGHAELGGDWYRPHLESTRRLLADAYLAVGRGADARLVEARLAGPQGVTTTR